jgi:CubicO group peptidase (beta-lactamase class C family)
MSSTSTPPTTDRPEVPEVSPCASLDSILGNGWHRSAQVYASVDGVVVLDVEVVDGTVTGTTAERRLFPLLSAAKPIVALAALKVCRDAGLGCDHPLVETIPELTGHGRERIRLRDVLTHQTGFPSLPTGADLVTANWAEGFAHACQVLGDEPIHPGGEACYQESRYWYLLGEFITRVTGRPVPDVVHSEVLRPLGLDKEIVLGREAADARRDGRLGHFESGDLSAGPAASASWVYRPDDPQYGWRGGVNTFGSVRAVAALLAALPGGTDFQFDGPFQDLPTMADAWRTGTRDAYFSCRRDWGLGVMMESARWGRRSVVFSQRASRHTYGHLARKAVAAFVDPVNRLTAAVLGSGDLNGIETTYFQRSASTAIYREFVAANRPADPAG